MTRTRIKRALISVYDKTGIVEFARVLADRFGVEIMSTGGTASLLKENGVSVTLVEEVTGFPEMMDGRVKTLHPKVHAAILADRDNPEHIRQLKEQGIEPIDMVVVNLYPFEKTIAQPGCTFEQAIEMIDIGGPCLLRAAAKNHRHVIPIVHQRSYDYVRDELAETGDVSETGRACLASIAYERTAEYDGHLNDYLTRRWTDLRTGVTPREAETLETLAVCRAESGLIPESLETVHTRVRAARYGENPHQAGALMRAASQTQKCGIPWANILSGEPSFNNYADGNAALELCKELTRELCATTTPGEGTPDAGRAKILFAPPGTGRVEIPFSPPDVGRAKILFAPDGEKQDVPPTSPGRLAPISDEVSSRRKLPHWQIPGVTYFVTLRSHMGELAPEERDVVMSSIRHWSGTRIDLHAAVVMRDHVHMLLTPRQVPETPEKRYNLSELLQSIKANSARAISKRRGGIGQVWDHESFDRWIRSANDFIEKWNYIANNPVKEGLAAVTEDYPWWYGVEAMPGDPLFEDQQAPGGHDKENLCRPPGIVDRDTDKEDLCPPQAISDKENLCRPPIVVFVKHTNACGAGVAGEHTEAYRRAYLGDPNAAMGGVLACNFDIDADFARTVMETYQRWGKEAGAGGFFVEVWIAPAFAEDSVEVIRTTKAWGERVRLLAVGDMSGTPDETALEHKTIAGGMLVQTSDLVGLGEDQWRIVTRRNPTDAEMRDLRLAWLVGKHTKSNAITICKDGMLIGNGAGQMSRVMSCRIATWLAGENGHSERLRGAVAASDAFFPFRDGPDILMDAGVTAIIQPGGSKRDEDTIAACDERGVAMVFTGVRHFRH